MKVEITINEDGITVRSSNSIYRAKWADIVKLEEFWFNQGEMYYHLTTKNKKIVKFGSSIGNYGDLLKEIEQRTGFKFKARL